ncbi:MAG TPA: heparan-alpha-glucosaminide N-acetyltransferase domain-containing protein [Polyangiaceae bacterium]|jgi:uncharacterized membrane protein|nr:heparan-alpha-glucosaminide N-acetyltransferase domain-containing protein [Polyangiaceae bacterium]
MLQSDVGEPKLRKDRLLAIDLTRGLAMVLMAVDHASAMLNRGRVTPGSRNLNHGAHTFEQAQFFLRWATHICPTAFIFLAGLSVALSSRRRLQGGLPASDVTRSLLIRGVLLVAIDFVWLGGFEGYKIFRLDVLTAIGAGFILLAFTHQLPRILLWAVALILAASPDFGAALGLPDWFVRGAFEGGPATARIFFDYPVVPWMGLMLFGYCWGQGWGVRDAADTKAGKDIGPFALNSLGPLMLVYLLLRGVNGWGNALEPRLDTSLQQWLNVSKNPPSLAYFALMLSMVGVLLALFSRWSRSEDRASRWLRSVLAVYGRTALFFYVIHLPLLFIGGMLSGTLGKLWIGGSVLGALLLLVAIFPLCLAYGRYKRSHDNFVTRYI